jgi:adenine-specific DNA-methyltransferase
MGRRWIMVELREHANTLIYPRIKQVINGKDDSGVTKAVGWKGGGGFRYFRLAPSLLAQDSWGNWVINPDYNAAMLAEAVCKIEGFTYAPSQERFWVHGYSTETDFIFVTTQTLTADQLRHLSEEVGPERTLLVCCPAWRSDPAAFQSLSFKKLPNAILHRCEWGRDDYSLAVANLSEPPEPDPAEGLPLFDQSTITTDKEDT